ncbi:hypothetical protein RND81_10G000100 [Saponaria officinalis]|uniref:Alcohol dehydrogenase n=1 Tax=Saponaria officinalis TaxID=3572 RepID=A0AAW1HYK0_SAPOF
MVVPVFLADCGDCNDCKSSQSNLCSKMPFKVSPWMPREESSRFMDLKGETLFHFLFVSSFSEYTVVDIAHVTKVDSSLPPNRACLLSCGVSTGIGAAWRAANITPGSTVAIFGLGAIGLAGWGKTIVLGVDQPDSKLSLSSIDVLCSGKTLVGSLYGGLKHKSDVPILAKLYINKEIQLDGFVTHEMKFDEINKAFELLVEGKCLRCVLWMD